jgi:hypothetical protein
MSNDLTQYNAVAPKMRPGDSIFFRGNAVISHAIKLFAPGPSHCAVVRQAAREGKDVKIIQSTIEGNLNGVQTSNLGETLANYGAGSTAIWTPLSDDARGKIDWFQFYEFCGASQDHVSYDKVGLVEFVLREIPIIGPVVSQDEKQNTMFCSAWSTALYTKSGLLRGINWTKVSPQDLFEMKLYDRLVYILGNPTETNNFNTTRFNTI